jgi:hypothetical protein
MTLATGTRLGPYEILASVGAGGMGEVYGARDNLLLRRRALRDGDGTEGLRGQEPGVADRFDPLRRASADGQRFLLTTPLGDETAPPITLVQNWTALLRQNK